MVIEFLIDGINTGSMRFGDIKEFETPPGAHKAKLLLHGIVKRSSKELKFSLKEGQIVYIEGEYSLAWGNMKIGLGRGLPPGRKLTEPEEKAIERTCNVCGKKSLDGETTIAVTAKEGAKERLGNTIVQNYVDLHRIRVFVCSDCKKDKESFKKAVVNKDTEFGRIGAFSYWSEKGFNYSNLKSSNVGYLFIKDALKDELNDPTSINNVTLTFHSPKIKAVWRDQFQGGIWIDGILLALVSYKTGFDLSINVGAGNHRVSSGAAIFNQNTKLAIDTEENKVYEFDCQLDRKLGGIKLIPRFPIN